MLLVFLCYTKKNNNIVDIITSETSINVEITIYITLYVYWAITETYYNNRRLLQSSVRHYRKNIPVYWVNAILVKTGGNVQHGNIIHTDKTIKDFFLQG